ncbi:hypothetical protein CEY00_Acc32395 [Actinidia chinensis var. chinensis]|uniref:Bifunctional inhibitor/plant lipid transfer protein/seed storage helical domain-containing protein n=1 Tax=Actinidia chinensis var. chinensis TaxID=1590841 RepID=A0A2R6P7Z8_ACTCC|nr:hypothetical protein CEY00_Acc32395 [Actinidia chinensis var. chinensis]
MSSLHSLPPKALTSLLLLFLTALIPHITLSQNPRGTSPPGPTISNCGPRLLPLVPCTPFVQGIAPTPARPCCDGLKQVNNQEPSCLCLLLNGTALSSFPINPTLAPQLPRLCNLEVDISACSGVPSPSSAPVSQVSSRTHPNSTIAASPTVTVAPRTSIMGLGFGQSSGTKLKMNGVMLVAAMAFMSLEVLQSPA